MRRSRYGRPTPPLSNQQAFHPEPLCHACLLYYTATYPRVSVAANHTPLNNATASDTPMGTALPTLEVTE